MERLVGFTVGAAVNVNRPECGAVKRTLSAHVADICRPAVNNGSSSTPMMQTGRVPVFCPREPFKQNAWHFVYERFLRDPQQ
jgi:hypothetical protein